MRSAAFRLLVLTVVAVLLSTATPAVAAAPGTTVGAYKVFTSDADFAGICRAFGVDGYDDPRVATIAQRVQHRKLTTEIVERYYEAAAKMSTAAAMARPAID